MEPRNCDTVYHRCFYGIPEMVHYIDLKEAKYQRTEASGLARMMDGVRGSVSDDLLRIERGGQIFDALFESFST